MTISVKTGAGTQAAGAIHVRTASGSQHAQKVRLRTGLAPGDLNLIYSGSSPLTVTVTPSTASFVSYTSANVSGTLTATPSGGTAPYSYAWTVVSFDAPFSPTISNAAIAAPLVTKNVVTTYSEKSAVFQVVVTDALGLTATATVPATFVFETFA